MIISDTMFILFLVSFAVFAGLMMTRVTKRFGLPSVTAYLIAGLLIGPCCLGRLGIGFHSFEVVDSLSLISDVALGFIAFQIGNEFRVKDLKKIGKQAAIIAVVQAISATILVDVVLLAAFYLLDLKSVLGIEGCITLGAIATATAPAATLMVVNQYKAKGPLTNILLPIVALDDAVGLVIFAISFGIAKTLNSGAALSPVTILVNPLMEVVCSVALGAALGFVFTKIEKFFHSGTNRITLSIMIVLLTVGLSMLHFRIPGTEVEIGFSSLLVCMTVGTVFCNLCDFSNDIMNRIEKWSAPLYVLFFVLSGAELNLGVFSNKYVILIGILYIAARSAGKIIGASVSAKAVKCSPTICKYLGITLLPQAGVALGMSVTVASELGQSGQIVRNIVLFAVLIYELVGPMLTKMSLKAAGEITEKPAGKDRSRFANVPSRQEKT